MQKNPYLVLGLKAGATKDEVENAYRELKAKYQELRFEEGDVGTNAAKMLDKLEVAYEECLMDLKDRESQETFGSSYGEIESLIKSKRLDEAQELLDKMETRDAEWHYQQANIYFKKQWHSEAKTQLEIACDLDPSNQKYKDTLERLKKVMNQNTFAGGSGPIPNGGENQGQNASRAGYANPAYQNENAEDSAALCCNALSCACCADTCCECMGGDCIPCC